MNGANEYVFRYTDPQATKADLFVEWATMASTATEDYLNLRIRPDGGQDYLGDRVRFYPFDSIVIVLGGEGQDPSASTDSLGGMFAVGKELYALGYDAFMFDEDVVDENILTADDGGAAYNEIFSAVKSRGVTEVAIYGFSHGGGSTKDLAEVLQAKKDVIGAFRIPFTAYVDAVDQFAIGCDAVRKPEATRMKPDQVKSSAEEMPRVVIKLGEPMPPMPTAARVERHSYGRKWGCHRG